MGHIQDVEVHLPEMLARFTLPDPPTGAALGQAIRSSLDLLEVAPDRITLPMYAATLRAAITGADFSLHLTGPTGAGKTALAALAQQHFGPEMDAAHLAASWASTANALEGQA